MARKGKGGHGKGLTAQTGGSGSKIRASSESRIKHDRQVQRANSTNRDEFLRTRRLVLAHRHQIDEYIELRKLFDDVINLRITEEEAEARAGGRSLPDVIQRLAELTEIVQKLGRCLSNVKHVKNKPLNQKAKVASELSLTKSGGSVNSKDA